MTVCEMKGFLSFLVLWILSKKEMNGAQIGLELEKRKGTRPSPGTIYPALKDLKDKELVKMNENKTYTLTKKGEKELSQLLENFFQTFSDVDEMKSCCGK